MESTDISKEDDHTILEKKIQIEELVFHGENNVSIEEFQSLLKNFDKKWIQKLIQFAGIRRPFHFKFLADLFLLTGNVQIRFQSSDYFAHYLYVLGILNDSSFIDKEPSSTQLKSIEKYENPIQDSSIWSMIMKNDLHSFVQEINTKELDIHKENILINGWSYTFIEFACYFGALDIVKYLLVNNVKVFISTIRYAIKGGSDAIIEFFEMKGYSFGELVNFAIMHHHNQIACWLYDNSPNDSFSLPCCIQYFNTKMLLTFLESYHLDINLRDSIERTLLHYAVINDDNIIIPYLLKNGINKLAKDEEHHNAQYYCKDPSIRALIN